MPRDRAIDVLRGWAIVLMITGHVGVRSHVGALLNLPLLVDAAGPFVLLSGLVLGIGMQAGKPASGVWRRAGRLYFIHLGLMAAAIAVHETTHRLRVPSVEASGGWLAILWKVPALRLQALDFLNILPLFVVFFALAPLVVAALRRGWTVPVVLVSASLWAYTQRNPGWFRFTDPAVGEEAFVLSAWQLAFFIGLVVGFQSRDFSQRIWIPRRRALLGAALVCFSALFVFAQLQRNLARPLGAHLSEHAAWLFEKATWGPLRALYTVSALVVGSVAVGRLLQAGRGPWNAVLQWLEVLGQNSLYCFLIHLPLALLASALLLDARSRLLQDAAALAAVAFVSAMARRKRSAQGVAARPHLGAAGASGGRAGR